jgi:hypothetical protein
MSSMPGDVYGGGAWMQQFADLLAQAAAQSINLADLLGYYREGYEAPREAPTEQQALEAIWANRPDIQAAYADWWRDRDFTPEEAVRNWLSISPEANGQSAVDFALAQGWVQPATEGSEGTERATLAREQWEAEEARRDREYADRLAQLEIENARIADRDAEDDRRYEQNRLDLLAQLDEERRRADRDYERLTGRDAEEDRRALVAEAQEDRRIALQEELGRASAALDERRQDWSEEEGRARLGLDERRLASETELARQGLGLDYLDTLSRLRGPADYFQYQNVKRAAQNTALPAWAQALVSGQTLSPFQGAGQMQAATPQTLLSGGQGSWLDQLAAAAGYGAQPSSDVTPPPMLQPQQQQQGWEQQMYQQMQNLVANPQSVRIDQWNSMMPSEQQMLGGMVEYLGGDMNDWLAQMQKAAPTGGKTQGTSYWSGW